MNSASPAATSAAVASHEAPANIIAQYTSKGATIYWQTPASSDGLSNYNVEISANGGKWKLISTVPASQLSLDVTKGAATGWTSFRVSSVYSDAQTISGKVFGLPGQFS
ncbi:MAG: hypothetical protein WCO85_05740 [Actinomycetes bacterium]